MVWPWRSPELGPRRQVRALWFCWLLASGHVLGFPAAPSQQDGIGESPDADSDGFSASETPAKGTGDGGLGEAAEIPWLPEDPGGLGGIQAPSSDAIDEVKNRQLSGLGSSGYEFFSKSPYANVVVYDSNDVNCDRNYISPPVTEPNKAGYPQDGTDVLRKKHMSCGVAPTRFVFFTSALSDYTDDSVLAKMQLRITCHLARFVQSDTCENVLDATGNFPRIAGCRFMNHEARLILATKLSPSHTYSLTLKVVQPAGKQTASDNSFDLKVEYYQMKVIEGTIAPVDMTHTTPNAKDESAWGSNYQLRGYITSFTWQPGQDYNPSPGVKAEFSFGIRTFGHMQKKICAIDFVAYPTNLWKIGNPGSGCEHTGMPKNSICEMRSYAGAHASESNGFRITLGNTPFENINEVFHIKFHNPIQPTNAYWTATSVRLDADAIPQEPYTVMLDKPISVLGQPQGSIAKWELASINIEQWVTLEIRPMNTMIPQKPGSLAGILVIIPPSTFQIIFSSAPQPPDPEFNALPCQSWPEEDRIVGRWVCKLEDQGVFKETVYRVRLRVRNPVRPAAARSWRVELWQTDATKPISITRSIRGMPVSGRMLASIAPINQLLSATNTLKIEFTPTQDIGQVVGTRLEVVAPTGFLIVKRCLGFIPVQLPDCVCQGNNANKFELVFSQSDAVKAGTTYIFMIDVVNPTQNVPTVDNFWTFNTVRPDGIGRDTARYDGFYLFPFDFKTFIVIPVSRKVGSQYVVVRFTPRHDIPFDDYLRVRAPNGVVWDSANLDFDSSNARTDARTFGTKDATVIFETPNVLYWQLTTSAEAEFEYGIRCRIIVPTATPVPNRWWIEQYRQTGLSPPNHWRYIAAMGAVGFDTQVLIKTSLEPFNIVEEAWQNPTLITFEATVDVEPTTRVTAIGEELVPAEVFLQGPPLFTYICPLTNTIYMPQYSENLPADVECVVDHQNEAERDKLHLYFKTGLRAGVKYAFTIDVVNALYVDPTANTFLLQTRLDGVVIEEALLQGFPLAKRMDNTRYMPGFDFENRQVEYERNKVSFIIGTTMPYDKPSILEVKAPRGFIFPWDCTNNVGEAPWIVGMTKLPDIELCQNQEKTASQAANIGHIYMTSEWKLGSYGLFAIVKNPMFTPLRNFWGFTIFSRATAINPPLPVMSEAWVHGFEIQVVLNPGILAYNPGNGMPGEAAINIIEIQFTLTTPLLKNGQFVVTAPEGFRFPRVCRKFQPCLRCHKSVGDPVYPGTNPLSPFTACSGNGYRQLTLTDFKVDLEAKKPYSFRILVINPDETFSQTDIPSLWWRFETVDLTSQPLLLDLNRVKPSYPVYQRVRYFVVDTLSRVGLQSTTLRIHFRTDSPLPPQQTVSVFPPEGMMFRGVRSQDRDHACYDEDPVSISREFAMAGLSPLISGVTRLPEWISCNVATTSEVILKNEESILGGRPLIAGPVYEVFVRNVTNPQSSPPLNIFRIVARTTTPLGKEVWASDGYIILPELEEIKVESSNPAFGLYATFDIQMRVITQVPSRGSILITAPSDYYFGPVIFTEETQNDPLNPLPPPQGSSPPRPPADQIIEVSVIRPPGWVCPMDFAPCIEMFRPECQLSDTCMNSRRIRCDKWKDKCNNGVLAELFTTVSHGSNLEMTFKPDVVLPAQTLFHFAVQGYNTRYASEDRSAPGGAGDWRFVTRDSDSEKTPLDKKEGVPGIALIGVIFCPSIDPRDTKIGVVENRVKITLRLTVQVQPRALMRIIHPEAFMRNPNAAFEGALIECGVNFPRSIDKRTSLNIIELEAIEEAFPADLPLDVTVSLSNPGISPPSLDNIWSFETTSFSTGTAVKKNTNLNVSGFKIFGEFANAQINGAVLSPTATNIVGAWFILKSLLPRTDTSRMKIWLPPGFIPLHECGTATGEFKYEYNKNREGVKNPFPQEISYFPIPSGTECYDRYDDESGLWYIFLKVDGLLDYGLDYAFEFGVTNPRYTPPASQNIYRFETLMSGVILHLRQNVLGFELEQIKEVHVRPSDTTTLLPLNKIEFYMMSDKYIPGGSKIVIQAPQGFIFTCVFFRTDDGLSNTTTCYVKEPNIAEFTIDSQDPKAPQTPFRLFVNVFNPEFTPQDNNWAFNIISPLGRSIDIRDKVHGFDITGHVEVGITPTFAFLGESNPLRIQFRPYTIMNQADDGNELVVTAPTGYIFTQNCTGFYLRLTDAEGTSDQPGGYPSDYVFPPAGIECFGYNNASVTIRLPTGTGLLINSYTLEIDVNNPGYHPNGTNEWSFITRVRNPTLGQRIVDANRTLAGFNLRQLVPINTNENAAPRRFSLGAGLLGSTAVLLAH